MFLPIIKPILRIAAFIVSLLVYAVTILAAYGGRFNPDIFTWPAVLTLALPFLAGATLIITIAWFAFRRIIPGALGVLTIIASWGPISNVSPIAGSKKPTPGAQTFTIMTYNMIHGWDMEGKTDDGTDTTGIPNRTIDYIIDSKADIVCVQELIKLDSSEVPRLTDTQKKTILETYPYFVGDRHNDLKVFSKYPVEYVNSEEYIDEEFDRRRYSFFKVNIGGHKLTLIDVHFKSFALTSEECYEVTDIKSIRDAHRSINVLRGSIKEKLESGFKKRKKDAKILRNAIDKIDGPLIICGDFNDVPESYAYRLLRGTDLKDAYVETGFGPLITYNQHAFWFHLDQILYRGGLQPLWIKKGKIKASDHYPLMAEFEFIPMK